MTNIEYFLKKSPEFIPTKANAFFFKYNNSLLGKMSLFNDKAVLNIVNDIYPLEVLATQNSPKIYGLLKKRQPDLLKLFKEAFGLKKSDAKEVKTKEFLDYYDIHEGRMKNLFLELDKNGLPPSKELSDYLKTEQKARLTQDIYVKISKKGLMFNTLYPLNIVTRPGWGYVSSAAMSAGFMVPDSIFLFETPVIHK